MSSQENIQPTYCSVFMTQTMACLVLEVERTLPLKHPFNTAHYPLLPIWASFIAKLATHWQHRLGISMGCQHRWTYQKAVQRMPKIPPVIFVLPYSLKVYFYTTYVIILTIWAAYIWIDIFGLAFKFVAIFIEFSLWQLFGTQTWPHWL